jgi:glycosyltransferase involved in cell wall biosynthesis
MEKVLIITYYWPPGSGAGVQRWLKFSKYLPSFGVEPVILTVDPEYATYPATDILLEKEISTEIKIYKTRATDYFRIYTNDKNKIPSAGFASNIESGIKDKFMRFIRGNFFIPDPRRGWNNYAFRKACEIIKNEGIKYIITTSPPHSTQLIGLKLKKKFPDIKWIADLRDPWTDIYYYDQFYPTFISKIIDRSFELQVLKTTDKIITVGQSLRDLFIKKLPRLENKIEVITNGFDEDDFSKLNSINPVKQTISYIGTLSDAYPIIGFLDALKSLRDKNIDFNLKFVGTVSSKQKDLVISRTEKSSVDFIPYVDHSIAINYMLGATILLLIIPDHQSNKSIITGKIFEYLASGKPVLCLGPTDGDAAEIIRETGNGKSFNYNDVTGIETFLSDLKSNPGIYNNNSSAKFNRKNLTSQFVRIIREME